MVDVSNPKEKSQLLHFALLQMYRKFMSNLPKEVNEIETMVSNPGTLSNFHKDCLTCIGNSFTGIYLAVNKFLPSTSVKLDNTIKIGTAQIDGELITKHIATRQTRFGECSLLVEATANFTDQWPSISISQTFDDFLYMSIAYSPQGNVSKSDVELEYYGRTETLAFKYSGWPSRPGTIYSTSYLRSITEKLALGSQITFRSSPLPKLKQRFSDVTYYARYRGSAYIACLDFSKNSGYHFSYFQNINKYLSCAVDVVSAVNFKEVKGTVAVKLGFEIWGTVNNKYGSFASDIYKFQTKVPQYNLVIGGHLASDGAVAGIFKKQFTEYFPISVTISGFYNFFINECGFGIGLSV
uniref:Peptidase A1 domain-containing protein n=1 Tax=Elaeophora elaphi TaxID=1147741 RepID=A0A158Q6T4_9BILA